MGDRLLTTEDTRLQSALVRCTDEVGLCCFLPPMETMGDDDGARWMGGFDVFQPLRTSDYAKASTGTADVGLCGFAGERTRRPFGKLRLRGRRVRRWDLETRERRVGRSASSGCEDAACHL